ncbi:tripartite tricarboxylate transporter TctB family protein [Billgrantia aerodenitrificans]|uniref:Tripartite tricarboxylate transporter TctB family protein n=1 Tax=Billgrantia aerodenitrificans TaxID=2733483 RepID=A0ABS9AP03_9GAMM|nr:tripartite tricarboxylate transporter TctB family protein [Halomonas aerodenitrificans]MCE8023362.1 tripartite tricarboxylate transporter TctB family protein [Halomonas aerodenitrificans]
MTMKLKEVSIGLLVLALAVFLLIFLIPEGVPQPGRLREGQLSPRFWPLVATSILFLSGLVLTAMAWFEKEQATPSSAAREGGDEELPLKNAILGLIVGFILLSGYYWVMTRVGMVVASAIGIVLLGYAYGECRWKVLVTVALLLPVALYLFFVYVAGIPIPDPLARAVFRAIF